MEYYMILSFLLCYDHGISFVIRISRLCYFLDTEHAEFKLFCAHRQYGIKMFLHNMRISSAGEILPSAHSKLNFKVEMKSPFIFEFKRIPLLLQPQHKALRATLDKLLSTGLVTPTVTKCVSLMAIVKKSDGSDIISVDQL
jgi:hypothetical protein